MRQRISKQLVTDCICEVIIDCWSCVYKCLPHTFVVDPGTKFRQTFARIADISNVKVKQIGVEAYSGLYIGERLH